MKLHIVVSLLILSSVTESKSVRNPTCGIALDVQSFVFLDKFCDDCYNLFRLEELYQMCQADCYNNKTFDFCLKQTLVDKETAEEALDIVRSLADPHIKEAHAWWC